MRKTVLIVTGTDDAHAAAVSRELEARGAVPRIWNIESFPEGTPFSVEFGPDRSQTAALRIGDDELSLEDVASVWLRRNMFGLFAPRSRPDDLGVFLGFEFESAFRGLADSLRNARWVNPIESLYAMESDIAQFEGAASVGLEAPRMAIENGVVINRDKLDVAADVRVIAAGEDLYVFERVAGSCWTNTRAPVHIEDASRSLVSRLGLALASIRLARTSSGKYLFLKCEAAPDWLDLEPQPAGAITTRVAELLAPAG